MGSDLPAAGEPEDALERARRAFVDGLIERGEAAAPDENGQLPPGATHEIVESEPGRPPEVRRRRFSLS